MTFNFKVFDDEKRALQSKRDRLYTEIENVRAAAGDDPDEGHLEKLERLNAGISKLDEEIRDLEHKGGAEVEELMRTHPESFEFPEFPVPGNLKAKDPNPNPARDAALRCIDRYSDILNPMAGDRLTRLVRRDDPTGLGARYINAVAWKPYESAFAKMLADPATGHLQFDPDEVKAVRDVRAVMAERSMVEGTDTAGGFGVPFSIDPSILLSSDGVSNPIRGLARTFTLAAGHVWKGVSSDGVSSSFAAESAEVGDGTPTVAQPVINVQKAHAFVPFSAELGQDYPGLLQELGALLDDSRNTLESSVFYGGTAAGNQPIGIMAIGQTGALGTAQRVQTAGSAVYAIGDNYLLVEALPPRYQQGATVVANPARFDGAYRLVGGNSAEPPVLPTREGPFLGRPKAEWSNMVTTTTTGSKLFIFGQWRNYVIVDRLGATVELIPMLLGTNRRPTGERGLYYWWRVGAGVTVANAFRYLEVR